MVVSNSYQDKDSPRAKIYNGLFILLLLGTIFLWGYSLTVWRDSFQSSIVYVLLGILAFCIFLADYLFPSGKKTLVDIPVSTIGWENFKFTHVLAGLGVAIFLVVISYVKSGLFFAGIPASAVSTFASAPPVLKALYVGSVALIENQVIVIFPAATLSAYILSTRKNITQTLYLFVSFLVSIVAGLLACAWHATVYANMSGTLTGIFLLFFIISFVSLWLRDSSFGDSLHFAYNFLLYIVVLGGTMAIGV